MKYNQFVKLENLLNEQGSSLNEFVEKSVNEANPNNLDIKKSLGLTRRGRSKIKLTNNAKNAQKVIMEKLLEKIYSKSLDQKRKILNQIVSLARDKKTPKEIISALHDNAQTALNAQNAQLKALNSAIDRIIDNSTKRVESVINNEKLSEKSQLILNNYWTLLTTQIRQNAYKAIIDKEETFIRETIGNNKDLERIVKKLIDNPNLNAEFLKYQKQTREEKLKVQGEEIKFEEGKTYEYTNKAGEAGHKIFIVSLNDDGTYKAKVDNKTEFNLSAEAAEKRIGKEIVEA